MEAEQREARPRRRGINWLGLVAFIVIAFGRRIVGFVQWLFAGGAALLPGSFDVALVLGGAAVVAVVVATLVTLRAGGRRDAPAPPIGAPPTLAPGERPPIAFTGGPSQLPTAPRFEPVISPKAALASVLIALMAAAALAAFLLIRP